MSFLRWWSFVLGNYCCLLHLLLLLLLLSIPPFVVVEAQVNAASVASVPPALRLIRILNHSKSPFDIFWVYPQTRAEILMSKGAGVLPGTTYPLHSYVGHEFVTKETPGAQGHCPFSPNGVCRISDSFRVLEKDEQQAVRITEEYQAVVVDDNNNQLNRAQQSIQNNAAELLFPSQGASTRPDLTGACTSNRVITRAGLCGRTSTSSSSSSSSFQLPKPMTEKAIPIPEDTKEAVVVDDGSNSNSSFQNVTELLEDCRTRAKARIAGPNTKNDYETYQTIMDNYVQCVKGGVTGTLVRQNEELSYQAKTRTSIAATLEIYACNDSTLQSTPDVDRSIWYNARTGQEHVVHIKHERPASRIHVVKNFIDSEECLAMEQAATQKLHRATVADGKGGKEISGHRKALQSGIIVDWSKEGSGDPIARLSRRVYDYCNHVLGLGIQEHGQEDLMSIQYEGCSSDDPAPDQYKPHCDGDCTGLPHRFGQRMATMVMYCTVPDHDGGGHTNFRNAGVHVKPEVGNAIFFSYMDPETKLMDKGFTEHSGCPVYRGSKKIVTQWIRYGVDTENPWNSFNTLGVKHSDVAEFQEGGPSAAAAESFQDRFQRIIGRSSSGSSSSSSLPP